MPSHTNVPAPTSPTYVNVSNPGSYIFDDPNVIFNDPVVMFDGGNIIGTNAPAPTTPTYTNVAGPS